MAPPKMKPKPFTMVRRSLWDSKRFSALPNDAARYLYLYFLTSQHQTGTGCFKERTAYILSDLAKTGSTWTGDSYSKVRAQLLTSGLILADDETGEILIAQWWKDNGPTNESWFAGARKQCEAIESEALRDAAQSALGECWEAFQEARGLVPPGRTVAGPIDLAAVARDRISAMNNRLGGNR